MIRGPLPQGRGLTRDRDNTVLLAPQYKDA